MIDDEPKKEKIWIEFEQIKQSCNQLNNEPDYSVKNYTFFSYFLENF